MKEIKVAKEMRENSDKINKDVIERYIKEIEDGIKQGIEYSYKEGGYQIGITIKDIDTKYILAIKPYLQELTNKLTDLGYYVKITSTNKHHEKSLEDLRVSIEW